MECPNCFGTGLSGTEPNQKVCKTCGGTGKEDMSEQEPVELSGGPGKFDDPVGALYTAAPHLPPSKPWYKNIL